MTDTYKVENIENLVLKWSNNLESVKEGEVLRSLQMLDKIANPTIKQNKLKGKMYSILAYTRFKRLNEVDPIAIDWLDKAMEVDPHDPLINEVYIKIYSKLLEGPILSETFPQIRETDHSNTKKKLANDYLVIANDFFERVPSYEANVETLINAARRLYDDEMIIKFETLFDLLQAIKKPLSRIVKSTEAYSDSVKGIYYSKAQLSEIKESIAEIEEQNKRWLEIIGETDVNNEKEQNAALHELEKMIGLSKVKVRVAKLYHYLNYQKIRKEKGYHLKDELSLNMILTGNPGTGKTTLARLLAKIYYELGILPREEVIEVDRSHLVGGYVGQTEENTINVIKQAVGGVLFIDEAYSLKRDGVSGNDYGQTAIDTLVSAMTSSEYAGKFALVLAGYPEEMRQFLWANPGLRSRFPENNHIDLEDYSIDELVQIAEQVAIDNDFSFSEAAIVELKKRIEKEQVDPTFGNARTVKNIVIEAIFQKGSIIKLDKELSSEDFTILDVEDVRDREQLIEEACGMDRLNSLVGLSAVKNEVKSLVSFVKVQQLRRENKLPTVPLQLHSVFTGNPGTGKTTLAKIYAQILKELGLLKRGHLVIAGRGDLVSGYTGQTALKTKKKIREALGGVLFIDEAYSLIGGQGDFGKEAINTLVEEMTIHNENLVVILAGYPTEMERLFETNPGIRSRFKKFFHFADYTTEELVEIVSLNVKKYGYVLSEDVEPYLLAKLSEIKFKSNGRYAEDLVDLAIQQHSYRISNNTEPLNADQLTRLMLEDFKKAFND